MFVRMRLLVTLTMLVTLAHRPLTSGSQDRDTADVFSPTPLTDLHRMTSVPVSTAGETVSRPAVLSQDVLGDSSSQTTSPGVRNVWGQPDEGRRASINQQTTGMARTSENSGEERDRNFATTTENAPLLTTGTTSKSATPWMSNTSMTLGEDEDFSNSSSVTFKTPVTDEIGLQDFGESGDSIEKNYDMMRTGNSLSSYEDFGWKCSAEGEKLCGCTETCLEIENCCQDSRFINSTTDLTREENPNYSCYSDFSDKWTLSSPSLLVDKCSKDWTDDQVRDLCEQPNKDEVQSYVPCYSPTTRLSYMNIHCLRCNGLNDNIPWEVTFQSGRPLEFSFIDSFSKMNDMAGRLVIHRGQQFVVSPKTEFEPAHCVPSAVKTCNPEVNTDKIRMLLCQAYYNPVIVGNNAYRNVDCFECFTGIDREDAVIKRIFRHGDAAMSVLLDIFGRQEKANRLECTTPNCGIGLTRIRGYFYQLTILMSVYAPGNAGRLSDLDRIKSVCRSYLYLALDRKLSKYTHETHAGSELPRQPSDQLRYRVLVSINEDIPISAIAGIQNGIHSLQFVLHDDRGMRISCCWDENGVRLGGDGELMATSADGLLSAGLAECDNQAHTNAADEPGLATFIRLVTLFGIISSFTYCHLL